MQLSEMISDFEPEAAEIATWYALQPWNLEKNPDSKEKEKALFDLDISTASESWRKDRKLSGEEKYAVVIVARLMCVEAQRQYQKTKEQVTDWLGNIDAGFNDETIKTVKKKMTDMTTCIKDIRTHRETLFNRFYDRDKISHLGSPTIGSALDMSFNDLEWISRVKYRMQILATDLEEAMSISKTLHF